MATYILSLDQGTSSSRAILFDHKGSIIDVAQKEFRQIYPQPGWVEHDAEEIWISQQEVIQEVLKKSKGNVHAIGITNQRETTVLWNRKTGKPVCNAIVWQDRRTAGFCDELKKQGYEGMIRSKTGLVIDAYFSATKLKWMLEHVPGAKDLAAKGNLAFGTIDSWLIWKLTNGQVHVTDVSNASRTMLFNIHTLKWDEELLSMFNIPKLILPEICDSSGKIGKATTGALKGIPIAGIAGDQQAALFGQQCVKPGMVKNTYGTGCFIVMNTGLKSVESKNNLLTTIAWKIGDQTTYALEGSVFIAGAAVQWLRDGLGIIKKSSEVEALAAKVADNGGVFFVPALTGLGAPYWDAYARGIIVGITRGTTSAHIARATLESIAFQTDDVLLAMQQDSGLDISELRVDGGASANNLLMQFQSDILQLRVIRPVTLETTALGAAYLAGLATGFWKNTDEIKEIWQSEKIFEPSIKKNDADKYAACWHRAVERSRGWEQ